MKNLFSPETQIVRKFRNSYFVTTAHQTFIVAKRMANVSTRQNFRSHLAARVAVLLLVLFKLSSSFVLPLQKRGFSPSNQQLSGYSIETNNDIDSSCDIHAFHLERGSLKSSNACTDRRQSLVEITSLVASALWAFPEIACASSSEAKSTNTDPSELPIDFQLSAAVQKLINLERPNRLVPGKDYVIDVQGRNTKSGKEGADDAAPDPLFRYLDPKVFEERATYKRFVALLDNYQPNVCVPEDNTTEDTQEAYAFLEACMATPVMKFCYSYCKSKLKESTSTGMGRYAFDTEEEFIEMLYRIWFQTYSRSKGCGKSNGDMDHELETGNVQTSSKKVYGSSGFEHVFVGEIRSNKVIGFHNWIQLYRQEQIGNVDYRGTMGKKSNDMILTYNLQWMGSEKPIGSSLIGVSPEFELALYTLIFLVGNRDHIVLIDRGLHGVKSETKLDIKCFRTKGKVGSCYIQTMAL